MDTYYVLKYPNGKLLAKHGLTGSPYPTEDFHRAESWKSAEGADKFRGVNNLKGHTIHKVTVTITPMQGS